MKSFRATLYQLVREREWEKAQTIIVEAVSHAAALKKARRELKPLSYDVISVEKSNGLELPVV